LDISLIRPVADDSRQWLVRRDCATAGVLFLSVAENRESLNGEFRARLFISLI